MYVDEPNDNSENSDAKLALCLLDMILYVSFLRGDKLCLFYLNYRYVQTLTVVRLKMLYFKQWYQISSYKNWQKFREIAKLMNFSATQKLRDINFGDISNISNNQICFNLLNFTNWNIIQTLTVVRLKMLYFIQLYQISAYKNWQKFREIAKLLSFSDHKCSVW